MADGVWSPPRKPKALPPVDSNKHLELIGALSRGRSPVKTGTIVAEAPSTRTAAVDDSLPQIDAFRAPDGSRLYITCGKSFVSRVNADSWRKQYVVQQQASARKAAVTRRVDNTLRAASPPPALASGADDAGPVRSAPLSPYRALMNREKVIRVKQVSGDNLGRLQYSFDDGSGLVSHHASSSASGVEPLSQSTDVILDSITLKTTEMTERMYRLESSLAAAEHEASALRLSLERSTSECISMRSEVEGGRRREAVLASQLVASQQAEAALRSELDALRESSAHSASPSARAASASPSSASSPTSSKVMQLESSLVEARACIATRDAALLVSKDKELALRQEVATLSVRLAALTSISVLRSAGGGASGSGGAATPSRTLAYPGSPLAPGGAASGGFRSRQASIGSIIAPVFTSIAPATNATSAASTATASTATASARPIDAADDAPRDTADPDTARSAAGHGGATPAPLPSAAPAADVTGSVTQNRVPELRQAESASPVVTPVKQLRVRSPEATGRRSVVSNFARSDQSPSSFSAAAIGSPSTGRATAGSMIADSLGFSRSSSAASGVVGMATPRSPGDISRTPVLALLASAALRASGNSVDLPATAAATPGRATPAAGSVLDGAATNLVTIGDAPTPAEAFDPRKPTAATAAVTADDSATPRLATPVDADVRL